MRWASRNTVAICVRRVFSGVSTGTSAFAVDEARDVVDARGLLATEDLIEAPAEDRVDRVEALGAMVAVCLFRRGLFKLGIGSHLHMAQVVCGDRRCLGR